MTPEDAQARADNYLRHNGYYLMDPGWTELHINSASRIWIRRAMTPEGKACYIDLVLWGGGWCFSVNTQTERHPRNFENFF